MAMRLTEIQIQQLQTKYLETKSTLAAAKAVGVSEASAYRYLRKIKKGLSVSELFKKKQEKKKRILMDKQAEQDRKIRTRMQQIPIKPVETRNLQHSLQIKKGTWVFPRAQDKREEVQEFYSAITQSKLQNFK